MSVTDQVVAETRCTRADTNMESRRHTNTADTHTQSVKKAKFTRTDIIFTFWKYLDLVSFPKQHRETVANRLGGHQLESRGCASIGIFQQRAAGRE